MIWALQTSRDHQRDQKDQEKNPRGGTFFFFFRNLHDALKGQTDLELWMNLMRDL